MTLVDKVTTEAGQSCCCRPDRDAVGLLLNLQTGFELVLKLLIQSCWLQRIGFRVVFNLSKAVGFDFEAEISVREDVVAITGLALVRVTLG